LHNQSYSLQLFWQDHHLFSICENVLCGINPNPHIHMLMIYNNLSEANLTNKSCQTFLGHYILIWSQSHSASNFFFIWSTILFSLQICHACKLFKIWAFMAWWFCHLGLRRCVKGWPNLPTYMWSPCLLSKCQWNNQWFYTPHLDLWWEFSMITFMNN
jgi:hypothetical protein